MIIYCLSISLQWDPLAKKAIDYFYYINCVMIETQIIQIKFYVTIKRTF